MRSARGFTGFTLIELMITVAIVAILAAVALPAYNDYITRSKFAEATSTLASMRVKMEQYYQDQRAYTGACLAGTVAALPTNLKYFTVSCTIPDGNHYTVSAAGNTGTDLQGITFTVNEANTHATSVTSGSTIANKGYTGNAGCWITRKGGTC